MLAVILLVALRALATQMGYPAWSALAADLVPTTLRGRYFASRNMAISMAGLICAPLAGVIIDLAGPPHGYQVSFAIAGAVGFVATVMYSRIPDRATGAHAEVAGTHPREILAVLRSHPRFMAFTGTALLWNLALMIAGPFLSVYLVRNLGASPTQIGILAAANGIMNVVGLPLWGRLNDRFGALWVTRLTQLLIPAIPVMWAFVPNVWWLILEESFSGFVWSGFGLANFNLMLSLAPETQRARFVAIYQAVVFSAAFAGPLVGSYLADTVTLRGLFFISAAGRLAAALVFIFAVRFDHERA